MKNIIANPIFLLGILIRLVLISTYASFPLVNWYAPFLELSVNHLSLDPWAIWLDSGGATVAFPYGYAMWLFFLPLAFLSKVMSISTTVAYGLTLFVVDLSLLLLLRKMLPGRDRILLYFYWLSPIVILASYGLGLNDLIPVLILTYSCYLLKNRKFYFAGVVLIASISAKFSMVLALPFFIIYMINNRAIRQFIPPFLTGLTLGSFIFLLPFSLSSSGLYMILNNPEMGKVYRAAIDLGGNIQIYIVPLIYILMLYFVWRVRRLNYELFYNTLGISFLLIVLATPSSPGWFVWTVPLLVYYQIMYGRMAVVLTCMLSFLYVLNVLISTPINLIDFQSWALLRHFEIAGKIVRPAASVLHTLMVATGIILAVRIWRQTVSQNDYFRLSRKPFIVGIAGDSGSGKDTLSNSIKDLFGSHSVVTLSGDDYHLWDRQKPIWQVMTPLNPKANDLDGFTKDLIALADGKSIHNGHYNHESGKRTKPLNKKSNDFVIASGLHALYLPILRDCYNLTIYLDIDENLRRYFKRLRDVNQRGHSLESVNASIERRDPDADKFIRPQAAHADLVFSLQPIHLNILDAADKSHPIRFKLAVRTRHGLDEVSLIRVLVGVCGLHVDMIVNNDASEIMLTIEGDASEEDVAMAAKILCPRAIEFLDTQPKWQDGVMGLMQLITLSHISQALTRRFI